MSNTNNGQSTTLDPMMAFKYAWTLLVNQAWHDSELKDKLLNRQVPPLSSQDYQSYIHDLFSQLGVSIPADMDLAIVEPDPNDGWNENTQEWTLRNEKLELPLPPAPDVAQQAVALAAYGVMNSSFICTC